MNTGHELQKRPRFGRAAWLTLAFALTLLSLSSAQVAYRFLLPTDGWFADTADLGSEALVYFRNLAGISSGLQPMDIVTELEGKPISAYSPGVRPPFWKAGQLVEYTVMRDGEALIYPVPIGHWTPHALATILMLAPNSLANMVGMAALIIVAFIAFFQRPNEPAARALLIFAAAFGASEISGLLPTGLSATFDFIASWASGFFSYTIFGILIGPSLLTFVLVFPKPKRIISRYPWLAVTPFGVGLLVAAGLYSGATPYVGWIATMLMLIASLASLAHSTLTMRDAVSRAQLLWAFGGFGLGIGLFLLNFPSAFGWVSDTVDHWMTVAAGFSIPVLGIGLGIAVLRYHLFDIDVIIRRTTSYAIITGLLALVYFGSIIILQQLLTPLTGESDAAVVLSTLLIAALFLPIRRRVQDGVDRRFNRTRYDAEKTIESFAAAVRNETDLDALTAELLRVIQQTMEPESLGIWLREPGLKGKGAMTPDNMEGGRTWARGELYDRVD